MSEFFSRFEEFGGHGGEVVVPFQARALLGIEFLPARIAAPFVLMAVKSLCHGFERAAEARFFWNKSAREVSEYSHGKACQLAAESGLIPYEADFISNEPVTDEDVETPKYTAQLVAVKYEKQFGPSGETHCGTCGTLRWSQLV
jgi:hypothetical protein